MRNFTRMENSYLWVTSHKGMSHVTYWETKMSQIKTVMSRVWRSHIYESCQTKKGVLSRIKKMNNVTNRDKSCHAYEEVISMSHVTRRNELCHIVGKKSYWAYKSSPTSSQKSPTSYQKRRTSYQKSPIYWNHLDPPNQALHYTKRALHHTKRDLYIEIILTLHMQPYILSPKYIPKEPYIISKEPYIISKKPCIIPKEPCALRSWWPYTCSPIYWYIDILSNKYIPKES